MPQAPPEILFRLSGQVNHAWAQLDALVSAAYVSTLNIDAVEAGITLGRLDAKAKTEKLKKIFRHRKNSAMADLMASISKALEDSKGLRNAMTHGYYLALTKEGEFLWAILPEFIIDDDFSGTQMFVATGPEINDHVSRILGLCGLVLERFGPQELRPLFDLPGRVR